MRETTAHVPDRWDPEPRWPALIAILAVGGLYLALPANLTVGPRWLFPAIVIGLLIPTVISHRTGKHNLNKLFGFTVTGVVTAANAPWSVRCPSLRRSACSRSAGGVRLA